MKRQYENTSKIKRDDIMRDKLSVKEYEDPFSEKTVKNKNNNPAKK